MVSLFSESLFLNPAFYLLALGATYIFFGLDDVIVDFLTLFKGIQPKTLTKKEFRELEDIEEKNIAIMIPAWDESDIIYRMLCGNIPNIKYKNFHIFVGTYPNDPKTISEVQRAEQTHPNVHCVVNSKSGPTSKGQILNHVIDEIVKYGKQNNISFDAIHMQDAEDIIHPYTLKLVNSELDENGFVQTPVFSLQTKGFQFVAGTYMDEFAEKHTKDVLTRSHLKAGVPSAGVGTAFTIETVEKIKKVFGEVFNEGSLTEDYELGLRARQLYIKANFACCKFQNKNDEIEYIATREFFPSEFRRSIRQKTRWTTGISLQGWENLSWFGNLKTIFFLYRDRKGIFANISLLVGYLLIPFIVYLSITQSDKLIASIRTNSQLQLILLVLVLFMLNRIFWRTFSAYRIYGLSAAFMAPFRIPLSNLINALACLNAIKNFIGSKLFNTKLKWGKTSHKLPAGFGQEAVEDTN